MAGIAVSKRVTPGSRHGFRLVLVVGLALLAAGAGLAISRGGAPAEPPTRAEATAEPAPAEVPPTTGTPSISVPEGKEPVAFDDGGVPGIAGFVDADALNGTDPAPVLDIGTGRYEARGLEVTDGDGILVGYFVNRVGFIDLATARDPAAVDARFAAVEALNAAHPPPSMPSADDITAG